jgi:TRAP-type mannitol/chloroaromatic compound transport system permease large subunit
MILGFCYRELRVRDLPRMFKETVSVSANVAFIIACSSLFGWVTTRAQIAKVMAAFFAQNISSPIITLILLNIMLLIVGMLLDNSAAIGILTPVLIPIILQYNIDPVHFGIIRSSICTSSFSPARGHGAVGDVPYYEDADHAVSPSDDALYFCSHHEFVHHHLCLRASPSCQFVVRK